MAMMPMTIQRCAIKHHGESNESMAETVLSMARSLVGSAISKAASAAANETNLLLGVEKDIWYMN
uniref:Uncharacterized protein n=1 Tax=Oryza barthii TaxID=65489 RepID=A0A0D3GFG4_9ORYZ